MEAQGQPQSSRGLRGAQPKFGPRETLSASRGQQWPACCPAHGSYTGPSSSPLTLAPQEGHPSLWASLPCFSESEPLSASPGSSSVLASWTASQHPGNCVGLGLCSLLPTNTGFCCQICREPNHSHLTLGLLPCLTLFPWPLYSVSCSSHPGQTSLTTLFLPPSAQGLGRLTDLSWAREVLKGSFIPAWTGFSWDPQLPLPV